MSTSLTNPKAVAADLLSVGAVALRPDEPFTWASGLKSPIYCDNRLTLASPAVRRRLTDHFAAALAARDVDADVVAGTATAGIPHAAWLADRLEKPLVYVRSAAKQHGRGNKIEGRLEPGRRIVLVEDTISTGGSSLAAVEALREAGAEVAVLVAIFSYGFDRAEQAFREAGVPVVALTDYAALVEAAAEAGAITEDDRATLAAWRADPEAWSAARG